MHRAYGPCRHGLTRGHYGPLAFTTVNVKRGRTRLRGPAPWPTRGYLMDSTNPSPDPYERGVAHGRRLGAYAALSTARRAMREAGLRPLAQALDRLVGPDDLALVLRQ